MKRIRVGIIGQGRSGRNIHRHLFETQEALKARFEVVAVAEERKKARAEKNWAKSDELREKLREMGYSVKDSKDGYELIPNA